jgi:hypothetical protein
MMQFDVIIKRVSDQQVRVTASDGVRFFWLFGVPYVVASPLGKAPADLATLDEAARAGVIAVT